VSQSQKEAAEYAEVLLAYSRGEAIQMRRDDERVDNEWSDLAYPLWDFARFEYRVAPKPVERWAVLTNDSALDFYFTKDQACRGLEEYDEGARVVLLREVTE
jgi:hypothetical protein